MFRNVLQDPEVLSPSTESLLRGTETLISKKHRHRWAKLQVGTGARSCRSKLAANWTVIEPSAGISGTVVDLIKATEAPRATADQAGGTGIMIKVRVLPVEKTLTTPRQGSVVAAKGL
jgi:hypothetical protein